MLMRGYSRKDAMTPPALLDSKATNPTGVSSWVIVCPHLLGRGAADADGALTITDDHHGAEAELLAALDDLGDAADLHQALREAVGVRLPVAPVVVASCACAGCTSGRQCWATA